MPQRDPGVYLEDIEHYAAAAVRFTSGFSLELAIAHAPQLLLAVQDALKAYPDPPSPL
jgi:hypothetical protein